MEKSLGAPRLMSLSKTDRGDTHDAAVRTYLQKQTKLMYHLGKLFIISALRFRLFCERFFNVCNDNTIVGIDGDSGVTGQYERLSLFHG